MEDDRLAKRLGSRWWTTANDWTPWEEPLGQIEINSIEECCSESPRRNEKQKASESDGRRRGTPAPKPSPTPKPTRTPSEDSATSEWSQKSLSSEGSWTKNFCEMERCFALQTEYETMEHNVDVPVLQIAETGCERGETVYYARPNSLSRQTGQVAKDAMSAIEGTEECVLVHFRGGRTQRLSVTEMMQLPSAAQQRRVICCGSQPCVKTQEPPAKKG